MCTVTFLPKADNDFILTSNRDESIMRPPALSPKIYEWKGQKLLFPKDPQGKGSWIAASSQGRVACLLNGAFKPHPMGGSYRKSRGLVLMENFEYSSPKDFSSLYDFQEIEPFTLILAQNAWLCEIRWDGFHVFYKELPFHKPHIWSSVPLYGPEITARREDWFGKWLKNTPSFTATDIRKFHKFGGEGDSHNDLVMNRHDLLITLSITSIERKAQKWQMIYEDLKKQQIQEVDLLIESKFQP
ncbi:NRDE family protein [Xanthovirga aplysinae]|uniref:NRDE family protein n=1 Tax=Xanthovirga aplysinae TaxID=2529853 RepID=UPI0012BBC1F7|nr:NRDE family protein [Xanthovirga aplysinae]MTI31719.1 hypothetical protein [Xanthovirga aplysinae]